jgi:hypothetical protein
MLTNCEKRNFHHWSKFNEIRTYHGQSRLHNIYEIYKVVGHGFWLEDQYLYYWSLKRMGRSWLKQSIFTSGKIHKLRLKTDIIPLHLLPKTYCLSDFYEVLEMSLARRSIPTYSV